MPQDSPNFHMYSPPSITVNHLALASLSGEDMTHVVSQLLGATKLTPWITMNQLTTSQIHMEKGWNYLLKHTHTFIIIYNHKIV